MYRFLLGEGTGRIGGRRLGRAGKTQARVRFGGSLEELEPRLVLYSVTGGAWIHPELVTVSFMPDGTDIAGQPSALFSTLNAKWATATWQKEILEALQAYAANSNLNFSVMADDGSPFGSSGSSGLDNDMQGDGDFGDIRIGAYNLGSNLGLGMLPPPLNQDTTAGDFFLNSTTTWNMGSTYDLFTVSAHEAGHSLGLGHSTVSTAVMYATYNGVKGSLRSDDIAGIQAIYLARVPDAFDAVASNNTRGSSTVITSLIDLNLQVTITGLDVTSTSDIDWYKITVPSGAASTMIVRAQSSGLSLLAPKLSLYNSGGSHLQTVTGGYNSTVELSRSISDGQTYYIKVDGADSTVFGTGSYALQVNLGTAALPAVSGPITDTPATGSGGNGSPFGLVDHDHAGDGDHHAEEVQPTAAADPQPGSDSLEFEIDTRARSTDSPRSEAGDSGRTSWDDSVVIVMPRSRAESSPAWAMGAATQAMATGHAASSRTDSLDSLLGSDEWDQLLFSSWGL